MSASPLEAAGEEVTKAFAAQVDALTHPGAFTHFFDRAFPQFFEQQAAGLAAMAEAMKERLPLNSGIPEAIGEFAKQQMGCHNAALELGNMFRAAHAPEIERAENPRTGEGFWDVSAQ